MFKPNPDQSGIPNPKPNPFTYKRTNYFAESLNQLFPKKLNIKKDDYEKIVAEVAQIQKDKPILKPVDIRTVLKKLGLPKYYEYGRYLAHRFNSGTNITVDKSVEQKLISKFSEVSASFNKLSDQGKFGNRKNFLNYHYILHKLCQLEGLDELDKYVGFQMFSMQKSQFHDKIWYDICQDLNWKFIGTNMTNVTNVTNVTYDKPVDKLDKLRDKLGNEFDHKLDEELEDLDELVKSIVIII